MKYISLIIFILIFTKLLPAQTTSERSYVDLEDIDNGYNIHIIYALPSDGIDKEFDLNSKIGMMVYQINKWFNKQTKNRLFPEGQFLKFDKKKNGKLDITFLRLGLTDEVISNKGIQAVNTIQPEIARLGFNAVSYTHLTLPTTD